LTFTPFCKTSSLLGVVLEGGLDESVLVLALVSDFSAESAKEIGDFVVVVGDGIIKRSMAEAINSVKVGSVLDEQTDGLDVALRGGQMEGSAFVVVGTGSLHSAREQLSHVDEIALAGGFEELGDALILAFHFGHFDEAVLRTRRRRRHDFSDGLPGDLAARSEQRE